VQHHLLLSVLVQLDNEKNAVPEPVEFAPDPPPVVADIPVSLGDLGLAPQEVGSRALEDAELVLSERALERVSQVEADRWREKVSRQIALAERALHQGP